MPQYGILIYSPAPADPMAISPEYVEALERYPAQVEELGGKPVTGFAFQPSTTAKSVRRDVVSDGTFDGTSEVVAGFFVVEALTPTPRCGSQAEPGHPRRRRGGPAPVRAAGGAVTAGLQASSRGPRAPRHSAFRCGSGVELSGFRASLSRWRIIAAGRPPCGTCC